MPDLLTMDAGRIWLRRADGSTVLDTLERMPAKLGEIVRTGVTLDWPVTSGETNTYLPQTGWWRHSMSQSHTTTPVVLGAYTSPVLPQFFWARFKLTQSVTGRIGASTMAATVPRGIWQPLMGSVLVETAFPYIDRHVNLAVTGGNLVLEMRQSGTAKTTDYDLQGSTRSVMSLDINVAWGVIDG